MNCYDLAPATTVKASINSDIIAKDHLIMNGKTVSIARAYYKYVVAGINIIEEE